jgi:hypothetical protein
MKKTILRTVMKQPWFDEIATGYKKMNIEK